MCANAAEARSLHDILLLYSVRIIYILGACANFFLQNSVRFVQIYIYIYVTYNSATYYCEKKEDTRKIFIQKKYDGHVMLSLAG